MHKLAIPMALILAAGALAGCADNATDGTGGTPAGEPGGQTGTGGQAETLQQAGSSTVLPIAVAWATELAQQGVQVAPKGGGSTTGAKGICAGELDIGDMSRTLKQEEIDECRANGIEPQVWKVAYDGITIVVNTNNDFVDCLSVAELQHMWRAEDPARTWADVRPGWPAEEIELYGPDDASGTYEYFNEEILDKGAPRDDYSANADDNFLVTGVSQSENGLGYFGYAYYIENQDKLKAIPIVPEGQEGCSAAVAPSPETIAAGDYAPLGRPIFMVTDGKPAAGSALHEYFTYAMNEGQDIVPEVGYVALDEAVLNEQRAWL